VCDKAATECAHGERNKGTVEHIQTEACWSSFVFLVIFILRFISFIAQHVLNYPPQTQSPLWRGYDLFLDPSLPPLLLPPASSCRCSDAVATGSGDGGLRSVGSSIPRVSGRIHTHRPVAMARHVGTVRAPGREYSDDAIGHYLKTA
jgi:hypothetical protein